MAQQPLAPEHPSGENRPSQVPSDSSQTSPGTDTVGVPQYGLLELLVLHLLPGALATLAYLALVPPWRRAFIFPPCPLCCFLRLSRSFRSKWGTSCSRENGLTGAGRLPELCSTNGSGRAGVIS